MERLLDQVNVLAAGYEAQGLLVPQQDELVKQAYHTVFGNKLVTNTDNDLMTSTPQLAVDLVQVQRQQLSPSLQMM